MSLLTDLVAYYELDETSGTRVDAHTGGYDLSDVNTVGSATGVDGNAASFNSANNETLGGVTSIPNLNSNAPFSFSYWVNTTQATGFVSTRCNTSAHAQWNIMVLSGTCYMEISPANSGSNQLTTRTTATVNNGAWRHIVLTYDGSRTWAGTTWYIDGSVAAKNTSRTETLSSNAPTGTPFYIGSRSPTFASYFNGDIDLFGIWSKELTSTEVTDLYNSGSGLDYAGLGGGGGGGATFKPKVVFM